MSELRSLVDAARKLRDQGGGYLVATVVDVHGSSYRRPGARMLFTEQEWLAGSVSGGCLERDVVAKGPWRTRDGRAQLVIYDGATDERSGSGCEGIIEVLVERIEAPAPADEGAPPSLTPLGCPIRFAERCLAQERCGVLLTVFRSPSAHEPTGVAVGARYARLDSGESESSLGTSASERALHGLLEAHARSLLESHARALLEAPSPVALVPQAKAVQLGGYDLLLEVVVPPTHLFIFGGAHDALPVLTLAKTVGWSVTVWEPSAQLSTRERFRAADAHLSGPIELAMAALARCLRPAAVIMAHHYERDFEALAALVDSKAQYIGLLGSRVRSARLLADLTARGRAPSESMRARIHAPVGLSIGAESPQEIALSIVAEVQACCASDALTSGATTALVSRDVELTAMQPALRLASGA